MKTVITFGTFDLFHIGHLQLLKRARSLGDRLVVGVSSDSLTVQKKQRSPVFSELERIEIISSLKCVDNVFLEESLDLKSKYIQDHEASILVMGDDWLNVFDSIASEVGCRAVYFPRTPGISTTELMERIRNNDCE